VALKRAPAVGVGHPRNTRKKVLRAILNIVAYTVMGFDEQQSGAHDEYTSIATYYLSLAGN
jgi:hypothetical protein